MDEVTATTIGVREPTGFDGSFVLAVTDGPDRGARMDFDAAARSRVLVGQSPACDLRLTDPEVSRRHMALEVVDGGVRITDLGSTNGTYVDRVRVTDAVLEGSETLRIGVTTLSVTFEPGGESVALPQTESFGRILGGSRAMRRLYPLCAKLAAANVPLVIEGETGTGKELFAEALHEAGARAQGPFVVFDCTTAPPNLIEAELFGHERGSFTGAVASRRGVFEQAHGGTLLIDEIGDLDITLQAKLLRAIERREVRRIGGDKVYRVDVRIMAATRRDLDKEVAAGRFRDDLFHRLAVARIELPPLRERLGDIELIARAMWAELGGDPQSLPTSALAQWSGHVWPGNIRELRNAVARLHALGDLPDRLDARPERATAPPSGPAEEDDDGIVRAVLIEGLSFGDARTRVLAHFERRFVEHHLAAHGGDLGKAASATGIGRRYFQMIRARARGPRNDESG